MSCRVLVVDDSTTIQKIFKITLAPMQVDVVVASNYIEAMGELQRKRADLVVVDANLPGITGPTEVSRLSTLSDNAPVLLLAGSHEPFDARMWSAQGFAHVLRKPFEMQDITRTVQAVLGQNFGTDSVRSVPTSAPSSKSDFVFPPLPGKATIPTSIPIPLPEDVSDHLMTPPPPPNFVDETRRGRKAFDGSATQSNPTAQSSYQDYNSDHNNYENRDDNSEYAFASPTMDSTVVVPKPPPAMNSSNYSTQPTGFGSDTKTSTQIDNKKMLENFLVNEAPIIVRKAVEKYCEQHFPAMARDVLTNELRRLAEEKSRALGN